METIETQAVLPLRAPPTSNETKKTISVVDATTTGSGGVSGLRKNRFTSKEMDRGRECLGKVWIDGICENGGFFCWNFFYLTSRIFCAMKAIFYRN